jgi:hypothetical protein
MNSRSNKLTWTVWVLCLLGFLVSCQDTIPYRTTITPGSTSDVLPTCSDGQELVDVTGTTDATLDSAIPVGDKTYLCKDKTLVRPENAVYWKPDFCACRDSKAVSYGNCSAFCAGKNTNGAETLFANFTVTESISLGGLGNMYAWCKTNLPGDTTNPECELQAKDDSGNVVSIPVTVPLDSNSLTANISALSYDKTYVFTLVENVSKAKSDSVQMIKFSASSSTSVLGPLKNAPVSQYTCMVREFSTDDVTGDIYYDSAYRLHFYFIPRIPPAPIPAGNSNLICHDIFNPLYGQIDNLLYPRFEQLAGVFNLWDSTDPRFYDNNGNGAVDINEVIIEKTRNFGGTIPSGTEFFKTFSYRTSPELQAEAGNNASSTQALGFYMAPWIDQTTFKSYCLNSSHYNSNNPLFKALRDILGVDTEGIYAALKSAETVTDANGTQTTGLADLIWIKESDLKAVWFYQKAGVPTVPDDTTVLNNAVFFYYPLNKASPFVRTSTQRVYRVYSAQELNALSSSGSSNSNSGTVNNTGSTSSGTLTSYPPHDRKIGCIPKF